MSRSTTIRSVLSFALALLLIGAAIYYVFKTYFPLWDKRDVIVLVNREEVAGLTDSSGSSRIFRIEVPEGARDLVFTIYSRRNAATVNLYVRHGSEPTQKVYEARDAGPSATKLIAIRDPQPGQYYLMLHAAHGRYDELALMAGYAPAGEAFKVGIHAHRLYNGGDWNGPASKEPTFRYGLVRDWDISHLHDAVIWKQDGSIDFRLVDKVYNGHATNGAKVIKTFGTVPTWASKRPDEHNKQYPNWPGAKSGPRDLDAYEDYVFRFVTHNKVRLWATEGWNEPYACTADRHEFTTMTPTELADVQKRVYRATKRVSRDILVLSPPQAYVCGIPVILNARTSEGEPISQFFDALAWHPYNRSARGDAGPSFAYEVSQVRRHLAQAGLSHMRIINTEHGWLTPPKEGGKEFYAMDADLKAQVLYDTTQLARGMGLLGIVWYGYDNNMIGKPMENRQIAGKLREIYQEFDAH